MVKAIELEKYLKELFKPELFDDYCPNGLQIEGKQDLNKLAFAVSATKESIQKTVEEKACALIVHHGLFWRFHGVRTITGPFSKRVIPLIKNEINLFGYHLPLDGHMEIGNAVGVAKVLMLTDIEPFGLYKKVTLGAKAKLINPMSAHDLKLFIEKKLQHSVMLSTEDPNKIITSIGIITGGAKDDWNLCLSEGLDAYLTGEMSEHHYHEAKESGVTMFAAGHHATEKFGIQLLMRKIKTDFPSLDVCFFDSDNPA